MVPDREIGYKKHIMSMRTALAGTATTAVLVAALGNPPVVDAARDADSQVLTGTFTGFANWDVADAPGDVIGGVVLRLGVTLVLVALLCALAGRSRSRGAAVVGGWGALVVAAGIAGAAGYVYQVAVVLEGRTFSATYVDGLVQAANAGASFGLWTGWLVGLATAVATRTAPATAPAHAASAARVPATVPNQRITEPPPPWWAPTQAGNGDAAVRPGPTVFPPGGMPPAVPGAVPVPPAPAAPSGAAPPRSPGATHEMTTASGDPHPSDPDATQPVGIPPADADDQDADDPDDPDATTTIAPDSPEPTTRMPPRPD
jgi:hypothetical protein